MSDTDNAVGVAAMPVPGFTTERAGGAVEAAPAFVPEAVRVTEDDERERQEAFDSEFEWKGRKLEPWTVRRENVFFPLRLAMGAPSFDNVLMDYDAFTPCAIRILWLCHHQPEDWSLLRASPGALQAAIDTWADKCVELVDLPEVRLLALRIYQANRRNQHEPVPAAKPTPDDGSGN